MPSILWRCFSFLDSFSSASVTFTLPRWPTAFGALSCFVIGQWLLLRKRQNLLDAFQPDMWFSFRCLFLVFQLIEIKLTMCPSVCSPGRQFGGWECFQSWDMVQVVNIKRSVVEVKPWWHRWAVEICSLAHLPAGVGSPKHRASRPLPPHGALAFCVQPIKSSEQSWFILLDETCVASRCAAVPAEGSACPQVHAVLLLRRLLSQLRLRLPSIEAAVVCKGVWGNPRCSRTCW